jgi:hypothetical protein
MELRCGQTSVNGSIASEADQSGAAQITPKLRNALTGQRPFRPPDNPSRYGPDHACAAIVRAGEGARNKVCRRWIGALAAVDSTLLKATLVKIIPELQEYATK